MSGMWFDQRHCMYGGDCCFRCDNRQCYLLNNTLFKNGRCHFQKETREGPNLYDINRDVGMQTKIAERRDLICYLASQSKPVDQIMSITGLSQNTVYRYLKLGGYMKGGTA